MHINWLEWLGYLASVVVLISLLMSSIIKLRWINLVGSSLFSLYGFLIGALPVGFMNFGIALINVYYLVKMYNSKEYFEMLPVVEKSKYLNHYIDFYKDEIEKYSNKIEFKINASDICFFILRNMVPAGIFLASHYDANTLNIELDFVIPEYRDFKIGKFVFEDNKKLFKDKGYSNFISFSTKKEHIMYLKKMGFVESIENGHKCYKKSI